MKICFKHDYDDLGMQTHLHVIDTLSGSIKREVFKCKKCGKLKFIYLNTFLNHSEWMKSYKYTEKDWTPDLLTSLSQQRKEKLKKINEL